MAYLLFIGVALLPALFPSGVAPLSLPPGVARSECRSRGFWFWIDKNFLGQKVWQLKAFNSQGQAISVTDKIASQCGFTVTKDVYGNTEIRVSFLGCSVDIKDDQQFSIELQLQVTEGLGQILSYQLALSCPLDDPWNPREIICEENYVEVSVRRVVPGIANTPMNDDWLAAWPVARDALSHVWQIIFHFPNGSLFSTTAKDSHQWGYGINTSATRVVFRAPYNTSAFHLVETDGFRIAVIRTTVFYKQAWLVLMVDMAAACPVDPPIFQERSLIWMTPLVLSPLMVSTAFHDGGVRMGLNGRLIDKSIMTHNSYQLLITSTAVTITVPIGAPGGHMQSDVIDNQYGTTYSINLLLERKWWGNGSDDTWHAAHKPITTPFLPHTPVLGNDTIADLGYFDVWLGNFFPDVELVSLDIADVLLSPAAARIRGFYLSEKLHLNGTKFYVLHVPFKDKLVQKTHLSGKLMRYTLYVSYTLNLVPKNKNFTITGVIVCDVPDVVLPTFEGSCTKDRLILIMTRGSLDRYWVPYVREMPLTEALVQSQNYAVQEDASTYRLEVPPLATGLVYEDITLRGLRVRLDFALRDNKTLAVKTTFSVTCNFPTGALLVCLPNRTMVATVLSLDARPAFDPRRTHLRDKNCRPTEADELRALFVFSLSSCGTSRRFDSNYLIYENDVTFEPEMIPVTAPVISRDSEYKLTIRCCYSLHEVASVWLDRNVSSGGSRGLSANVIYSSRARALRKRAHQLQDVRLRMATDGTYTVFHLEEDFPVLSLHTQPLFFQAELTIPHRAPSQTLMLQECWGTGAPYPDDAPQLDFIVQNCPVNTPMYETVLDHVTTESSLQRFAVKIQSLGEQRLALGQVYLHCSISACSHMHGATVRCRRSCNNTESRMGSTLSGLGQQATYVALGPIAFQTEDQVSLSHMGEETRHMWIWLVVVGSMMLLLLLLVCMFFNTPCVHQ
ncbi:uncharacterized protein LOC115457940 [Microcaecilia unicolor]|uniref:Uncharacterized protein LOC115457940 n=1 Tax=Microcaecilia unicolor TaxID=1415580 RepID=A0A6P7WSY7_9AMPH|nr:uncharacterized protein LOC115457940 [Microcaecilia unicolor]